jgi:hypothetical protein
MHLSPAERVALGACLILSAYRYLTGSWPVGLEVEET